MGKHIIANSQNGFNVRLRHLNFIPKLVGTRNLKGHADEICFPHTQREDGNVCVHFGSCSSPPSLCISYIV